MENENMHNQHRRSCCSGGWLKCGLWIAAAVILGTAFFSGLIFGAQYLWNHLMPALFKLPELTWLQTAGLMILSRLIFGGFGHRGWRRHRRHFRRHMCCADKSCGCQEGECSCITNCCSEEAAESSEEKAAPVKTVRKARTKK